VHGSIDGPVLQNNPQGVDKGKLFVPGDASETERGRVNPDGSVTIQGVRNWRGRDLSGSYQPQTGAMKIPGLREAPEGSSEMVTLDPQKATLTVQSATPGSKAEVLSFPVASLSPNTGAPGFRAAPQTAAVMAFPAHDTSGFNLIGAVAGHALASTES